MTQLEQAARMALEALETVIWAQDHQEDHWPVAIEHTRQAFLKLSDALNKTSFNPEIIYDEQEMLRLCPHFGPSPARDEWISGYETAITALRAALEQPAQKLSDPCRCGKQTIAWCMANTCSKAEQPAQDEPVAFRTVSKIGKAVGYWRADLMPRHIGHDSHDITPLYTRPQAREPLTDEQIEELCKVADDEEDQCKWIHTFARAIEAAHQIGVKK